MRRSTSLSGVASPRAVEPNSITSVTVFSFHAIMDEASWATTLPIEVFSAKALSETMNLLRDSRIRLLLLE